MTEPASHLSVRQLSLTNFRNYDQLLISLPAGVVGFVGANGQGKTNIVEAIGYLSTLSSHRVASDAPLIRHDQPSAVIAAEVTRDDRSLMIDIEIIAGRANKARINKVPLPRTRDILGVLTTVTFAPEDLALVRGDPGERRSFMNNLAVQRYPRLSGVLSDYDRVLKQRNALLKSAGGSRRMSSDTISSTLSVWDEQLARFGSDIMCARADLIAHLFPLSTRVYSEVAPLGNALGLVYVDALGAINGRDLIAGGLDPQDVSTALHTADTDRVAEAFLAALNAKRNQELDRGITLVGPHRDDLQLNLGPAPVKGYASHGESWSVALALRLGSYELLAADKATPVLILDDVFAELDSHRRAHLAERVEPAPQVLVTAAVEADVPTDFVTSWLHVHEGEVSQGGAR